MENRIEHAQVAGVTLEPNKKLGYYTFNKQVYYNKFHV